MQWRLPAQIKSYGMVILTKGTGGAYFLLSFSFKNLIMATFSNEKKPQHHPYYPTTHPKNNPTILTIFLKTFLTKSCKCPPPKKRKKSERSGRRESIMHAQCWETDVKHQEQQRSAQLINVVFAQFGTFWPKL